MIGKFALLETIALLNAGRAVGTRAAR